MGWLEDIQRGWFGKRRDPRIKPDDDKTFVAPDDHHPANAHTVSPNANFTGAESETIVEQWGRLDHHRSVDPVTGDREDHHDQKEFDNHKAIRLYTTAPKAKMETLSLAPDARWGAVPVPRNPETQSSGRTIHPFDQGFERRHDGTHFSMASNKRTYPIAGMKPAAISRRNTYRLDPLPHDLGIVDTPNQGRFAVKDTQLMMEGEPGSHTKSYRLGA